MLRDYYRLTKPGIIYGNDIHTIAGYMLACRGHIHLISLVSVLVGGSLVIACGCVINNYLDREIDAKMARTKQRALVTGSISAHSALTFATLLGLLGVAILALGTNHTTVIVGLIGLFAYVVAYGWAKRKTVYGTLVGSISGAMPLVAGYTAFTGKFDFGAFLLFLILVCWQIPHFYAIAIYRIKDYKRAGIPVWPAVKGITSTKVQMAVFIFLYTVFCTMIMVFGYAGYIYFVAMGALCLTWFFRAMQGFGRHDNGAWARSMFGFSLILSLAMLVLFTLGPILP
jgi:protoheme IX farnesyltransferase